MTDMLEVVIDSVRVSLMSPQRVVILRQKDAERYLPIWVGPYEAESITVALQEVEISRPLTHDLLKNVFSLLDVKLVRVEILALKEDIFYGNIVAELKRSTVNIDARPSDALALAVRTHIPILVAQPVMDEAGIVPENNLEQEASTELDGKHVPENENGLEEENRLDVFEDFLKKLGTDKGSQEKPTS